MLARITQHVTAMIMEPIRPFDWWMLGIEVAVLILIAIEVCIFAAPEWIHKRKARKHLKVIALLLKEGHRIMAAFPSDFPHPTDRTFEWMELVEAWSDKVEESLGCISPFAAQTFSFAFEMGVNGRIVRQRNKAPMRLSGELGDSYQIFQSRLRNLQQIVAKPEVYL